MSISHFSFLISQLNCVPLHPQTQKAAIRIAPVAELVDALDLGSNVSRRAGSSPVRRTENKLKSA